MTNETFTVIRDNNRDIRFSGELIAEASSSADKAGSDYSGSTGRWTELRLYKTTAGKFICEQIGRTQWQGEHARHSAAVCDDAEAMIEFFGTGWLAKELYDKVGIDAAETVE